MRSARSGPRPSSDTHLIAVPLPADWDVELELYLKDESTRPTYLDRYYSDSWLVHEGIDIVPYLTRIESFRQAGVLG